MGKKGWGVVVFALALVVGFFSWEWFLSPEARVERTLDAAAAAAETADAETFLSFFAEDYSDFLHPDREALVERVRDGFGRVDRMNVTLRDVAVDVEDDEAKARFDLVVVAIRGEERYVAVGTPFDPENVEADLKREEGQWKLHRVDRRRVTSPP